MTYSTVTNFSAPQQFSLIRFQACVGRRLFFSHLPQYRGIKSEITSGITGDQILKDQSWHRWKTPRGVEKSVQKHWIVPAVLQFKFMCLHCWTVVGEQKNYENRRVDLVIHLDDDKNRDVGDFGSRTICKRSWMSRAKGDRVQCFFASEDLRQPHEHLSSFDLITQCLKKKKKHEDFTRSTARSFTLSLNRRNSSIKSETVDVQKFTKLPFTVLSRFFLFSGNSSQRFGDQRCLVVTCGLWTFKAPGLLTGRFLKLDVVEIRWFGRIFRSFSWFSSY